MKRTILTILFLVAGAVQAAFSLTGGFAPCYERPDCEIICLTDKYIPLWELVPSPGIPVPEEPKPEPGWEPTKENAFDSCGRCHQEEIGKGKQEFMRSSWTAANSKELHGESDHKSRKCTACHSQ